MGTRPAVITAEELLAHGAWLRRLAGALCSDQSAADDAVQDTFVAALVAPPGTDRPVRPWLATVLRNFLRRGHRSRVRGERREREAGERAGALAGADELLAQHQALRLVAEVVAELDEPFRATILYCYGEGLAPAEVAARLGVPAGTVRWRLKRGLELIRQALDDRSGGDRRRWALLLASAAGGGPGVDPNRSRPFPLVERTNMKPFLLAGGVAVAIAFSVVLVVRRPGHPAGAATVTAGRLVPLPRRAAPLRLAVVPPPADAAILDGWVRDGAGRGVSGARLALFAKVALREMLLGDLTAPAALAETDGQGRFRLPPVPRRPYGLTVTAPGFQPRRTPEVAVDGGPLTITLVEGGVSLRGRVVDAGGGPLAGATVIALLDFDRFRDADSARSLVVVTDADGRYGFGVDKGTYVLNARADGYGGATRVVQVFAATLEDFRLRAAGEVAGRVVQVGGHPVPGAVVELGPVPGAGSTAETRADVTGAFLFRDVAPGRHRLGARSGALLDLTSPLIEVRETLRTEGIVVEVRRGRIIAGRATGADGAPVSGAEIDLVGPEGGWRRRPDWVTGPDGRFQIEGVRPLRYRLRVGRGGFYGETVADVTAGDNTDIALALRSAPSVRGQVLDAAGRPAADANVLAWRYDPVVKANSHLVRTTSDAEGRFSLPHLLPGRLILAAEGERFGAVTKLTEFELGPGATEEAILRLGPGVAVRGTVRWSDGRPAAGVLVRGFSGGWVVLATRAARTAVDGSFVLERAPSGDIRVLATADDDAVDIWQRPAGPDLIFIPIRGGVAPAPVTLTLPRHR